MYIGERNPSNVSYCQLKARDVGSSQLSRVVALFLYLSPLVQKNEQKTWTDVDCILLPSKQPGNILFRKPFEKPKKIEKLIVKWKKIVLHFPVFAKHPGTGNAIFISNEHYSIQPNPASLYPKLIGFKMSICYMPPKWPFHYACFMLGNPFLF